MVRNAGSPLPGCTDPLFEGADTKISVVIVNYNGRHFLDNCLASVRMYVPEPREIVVVDNASTDGSPEYLEYHHPDVVLIKSEANLGFTGGNNLGVSLATGNVLLLLNNDTVVLGSLKPALSVLARHGVGVVGCRLRYGDGRQQFSVGLEHTPWRIVMSWVGLSKCAWIPSVFRRHENRVRFYEREMDGVAWVSGACLLARKDTWERVRGFDDRYFMYMEDVDLCRRVRESGERIVFTPDVEVTHYEGAGREWIGERALRNTVRSYLIYTNKFYGTNAVTAVRAGLVMVLWLRSTYYSLRAIFAPSGIYADKKRGYGRAVTDLVRLDVG